MIFQQAGRNYLLYQVDDDYRLFDPVAKTDQHVLEWLAAEPIDFPDKGLLVDGNGQVMIRIQRSYGFDLSDPLTIDALVRSQSYTATMRPVLLPEAIMLARAGTLAPNRAILVSSQTTDGAFIWLDLGSGVVRQYCSKPSGFRGMSPDSRFAAFTRVDLPNPQPLPKTTFVLDLETGYMAQIDDFEFVGWAKAGD
jgi:hypothetical protein